MSRPFSYNDENFTVIGNVLFIHIIDNKARKAFEPVVEVPPAIFERIECSTNFCVASYYDIDELESDPTSLITISNSNNRNYFVFGNDRNAVNNTRLYWSIYFLKDI